MELYDILLKAHSGIRWLVVLVGVITLVKLLMTWLGNGSFGKGERGLLSATAGLFDLMFLLGLVMLILHWTGDSAPQRNTMQQMLEHGGANLIAVILVHIAAKARGATDAARAQKAFIFLAIAFGLVALAISRLTQGWIPT